METFIYALTSGSLRTKLPQVSAQAKRLVCFQVIWKKKKMDIKTISTTRKKYSKLKFEFNI